ncbi:hypothetical protein S245_044833, partial [Arachis hypogaea]
SILQHRQCSTFPDSNLNLNLGSLEATTFIYLDSLLQPQFCDAFRDHRNLDHE